MRLLATTLACASLVLLACTGDVPTDPAVLGADQVLFNQGATGAQPGSPADQDLQASDHNADGVVCVKTVPEGQGQAPERTIVKDNKKDGTCPGGFDETSLSNACEHLQPVSECDCDAAGGIVVGPGLCAIGGS